MKHIAIGDVENVPHFMRINSCRKPISRAIEEMDFAMVYFELDPDEAFSSGLNTHHDQEKLFYIIEGTATFKIKEEPGAEPDFCQVGPDEVIHFEKGGPYQSGSNRSDEQVIAIALGVPHARHGWSEVEVLFDCPSCDKETVHHVKLDGSSDERMPEADELIFTCQECKTVTS